MQQTFLISWKFNISYIAYHVGNREKCPCIATDYQISFRTKYFVVLKILKIKHGVLQKFNIHRSQKRQHRNYVHTIALFIHTRADNIKKNMKSWRSNKWQCFHEDEDVCTMIIIRKDAEDAYSTDPQARRNSSTSKETMVKHIHWVWKLVVNTNQTKRWSETFAVEIEEFDQENLMEETRVTDGNVI